MRDEIPTCAFSMWAKQSAMYVRTAKVESGAKSLDDEEEEEYNEEVKDDDEDDDYEVEGETEEEKKERKKKDKVERRRRREKDMKSKELSPHDMDSGEASNHTVKPHRIFKLHRIVLINFISNLPSA